MSTTRRSGSGDEAVSGTAKHWGPERLEGQPDPNSPNAPRLQPNPMADVSVQQSSGVNTYSR